MKTNTQQANAELVAVLRQALTPTEFAEVFSYLQPGAHRRGPSRLMAALVEAAGGIHPMNTLMEEAGV